MRRVDERLICAGMRSAGIGLVRVESMQCDEMGRRDGVSLRLMGLKLCPIEETTTVGRCAIPTPSAYVLHSPNL